MITKEGMQNARLSYTVAFKRFTTQFDKNSNTIFCFYEGEDGKYYDEKNQKIFRRFLYDSCRKQNASIGHIQINFKQKRILLF